MTTTAHKPLPFVTLETFCDRARGEQARNVLRDVLQGESYMDLDVTLAPAGGELVLGVCGKAESKMDLLRMVTSLLVGQFVSDDDAAKRWAAEQAEEMKKTAGRRDEVGPERSFKATGGQVIAALNAHGPQDCDSPIPSHARLELDPSTEAVTLRWRLPDPKPEPEPARDFEAALRRFLAGCQEICDAHDRKVMEGTKYHLQKTTLERCPGGRRYVRIKADGSAWCFVDKTNGDVLKPASWKTPAKHARGNVYDEFNGLSWMSAYGPAYLR